MGRPTAGRRHSPVVHGACCSPRNATAIGVERSIARLECAPFAKIGRFRERRTALECFLRAKSWRAQLTQCESPISSHRPLNRHIECLAEYDWVDIGVPIHLMHPHEDSTPSPSGRKYSGVVVSSQISALTATAGLTTCDAWLALAEESMSPCRVDVSSSGICHAVNLTRACAHALGTAEKHLRTESHAFKKPTKTPPKRVVHRPHNLSRLAHHMLSCLHPDTCVQKLRSFAPFQTNSRKSTN